MIAKISGVLLEKHPPQVLVDVHGIGYEIDVPMSTFYQLPTIGETVTLHTHFVIREDAHLLFGFSTIEERAAFRQLIKISGIGARTALALLSGLSVLDLQETVVNQDADRLIKVPGIGKKTAERLLLELRDKLNIEAQPCSSDSPETSNNHDILNALFSLGYNEREVGWVIKQIPKGTTVSEGIKQALKLLSKK